MRELRQARHASGDADLDYLDELVAAAERALDSTPAKKRNK